MENTAPIKGRVFTPYQVFIIAVLTFLQFTIILDFMVLSPLGDYLMKDLSISTAQFGLVVSAYAFSAGISGIAISGFADRFDRKKLLVLFYTGFIIGTLFCGIAPTYHYLLIARIFTGIFGGVIGSITFAIITDLFALQIRGRVMGFVQMAFAGSQVLGIPIGRLLAERWNWHFPFLMIVGVSLVVYVLVILYMKPVDAHLKIQTSTTPLKHLYKAVTTKRYLQAFAATTLLATGGFMLMPFGSAFSIYNLGVDPKKSILDFFVTGIVSMATGPFIGKASDKFGKYNLFFIGSVWSIIMVLIYTQLTFVPLWVVFVLNALLFIGVSARIISSSALLTAIPSPQERGVFMSVNASVQQISGGFAAIIAGLIVYQATPTSPLEHYPVLGYVVSVTTLITIVLMYLLNRMITRTQENPNKPV